MHIQNSNKLTMRFFQSLLKKDYVILNLYNDCIQARIMAQSQEGDTHSWTDGCEGEKRNISALLDFVNIQFHALNSTVEIATMLLD